MSSDDSKSKETTIMAEAFPRMRSAAQKIFDNIIFLGDIFADREDEEIPDIPVLELAKSFELRKPELLWKQR
jgi:hypothetical protein